MILSFLEFRTNHYYLINTDPDSLTMSEAQDLCSNRGGHLAMLRGENEWKLVEAVKTDAFWAWIGLVYMGRDQKYRWIDGTDVNGDFSWLASNRRPTIPDNQKDYCFRFSQKSKVHPVSCSDRGKHAVCQIKSKSILLLSWTSAAIKTF